MEQSHLLEVTKLLRTILEGLEKEAFYSIKRPSPKTVARVGRIHTIHDQGTDLMEPATRAIYQDWLDSEEKFW